MDLTHLNRTRDDETVSLFDLIPPDKVNLERGRDVTIEEKEPTNICGDQVYTTTVSVDAVPESGIVCFDEDTYSFSVNMPPTEAPSKSPSESPSAAPNTSPSATPSATPSAVPTAAPSTPPIATPSASPSAVPTAAPTTPPSDMPSDSPSAVPTATLSAPPTGAPSAPPSDSPSSSPFATPSASPSAPPAGAPSAPPSVEPECILDLEVECVPPPGVESCNATPPPVQQCEGRPFEMGFIFNGGDCESSFNIQPIGDKFFCEDLNGPPPTARGEEAYIIVTALDDDILYFEGYVTVGELFTLTDGGNNFVADQLVTVYRNNDTADPNNVLQAMQYHSSCSQNLFLKDRFGSIQLVEWVNEEQGRISCFANQTFDLDVTVPIDIGGSTLTIQSLTVASNVEPFFFNLTDKVFGTVLQAGETLEVTIAIPIELTQRRTYNLLITLSGLTDTGRICRATDLTSFTAGYPLPPIFPTFAPTTSSTGTPAPTVDLAGASCGLDAAIECTTASGRSCRQISSPDSAVCSDGDGATALEFLFTGNGCGTTESCEQTSPGNIAAAEVYVEVVDGGTSRFSGVVALGQIFRLSGPFDSDQLEITISSVSNGGPGGELQVLSGLDLGCSGTSGEDLSLLTNYGAVQLVGFTNPSQGTQSIIETFTLTMSVTNVGNQLATVNTAVGSSAFEPGPINLITGPSDLAPGASVSAQTFAVLNLADSSGQEFQFEVSATGVAPNGQQCSGLATFSIAVE